jgi:hypothetical protein
VKESQSPTVAEGLASLTLPSDSSDRPRSKSSPHINNMSLDGSPKDALSTSAHAASAVPGSARKGRFTVTTGGSSSSAPPSPMKPQTPVQDINQPHPLSNGPVLLTSDLISPTAAASAGQSDAEGSHLSSLGIAMEHSKSSISYNSTAVPSSVKKPKSRFTVKTISLEGTHLPLHLSSADLLS